MRCPCCQKNLSLSTLRQKGRILTCSQCKELIELRPCWGRLVLSILGITLVCGIVGHVTDNLFVVALFFVFVFPLTQMISFEYRPLNKKKHTGQG